MTRAALPPDESDWDMRPSNPDRLPPIARDSAGFDADETTRLPRATHEPIRRAAAELRAARIAPSLITEREAMKVPVALLMLGVTIPAGADNMFRGDPHHSGIYETAAVPAFHRVKWTFRTGGDRLLAGFCRRHPVLRQQ